MNVVKVQPFENIKTIMDGWIYSIIHRENAREKSHFRYISYDWIPPRGWFFWTKKRRGVFGLKEMPGQSPQEKSKIIFNIYYYPDIEEEDFGDFSYAEQLVRVSDMFSKTGVEFLATCLMHEQEHAHAHECGHNHMEDLANGKGIPTTEAREGLNTCLYLLGQIVFQFNKEGEIDSLNLEAPSRSATMAITDISVRTDDAKEPEVIICARGTDRNVPSWDIAMSFCVDLIEDTGVKAKPDIRMGINDYDINSAGFGFKGNKPGGH